MGKFHFTFASIHSQYQKALASGYTFITCEEYVRTKVSLAPKTIVNRIDIDLSIKKAKRLGDIYFELGIKATFFVRLHALEYNPFSFENYRIIKSLIKDGHEIGYHSEIIDQAAVWDESAAECLTKDIDVINKMYDIDITGIASHGGMTGLNNLDFWKEKKAEDFGLLYEAYDRDKFDLFHNSFYISDSEWTQWKCYDNGELCKDDRRSFADHLESDHELIYLLIHPDTYFDSHFYDNEK